MTSWKTESPQEPYVVGEACLISHVSFQGILSFLNCFIRKTKSSVDVWKSLTCNSIEFEGLCLRSCRSWKYHVIRKAGEEFASYSIVHEGRVVAHADNVAELSCLNYEHVGSSQARLFQGFCSRVQGARVSQSCLKYKHTSSSQARFFQALGVRVCYNYHQIIFF